MIIMYLHLLCVYIGTHILSDSVQNKIKCEHVHIISELEFVCLFASYS